MSMKKHGSCFALSLLAVALNQAAYAAEEPQLMGEVVVTGTREAEKKSETAATVGSVKGSTILKARPTHPSQVMSQVSGVWVSNLSGEGHSTSIRQPLTTGAVYLYLEDGIPTRSTGFFNHNALYEINIPQSGGIEVSKGPGSALYGSDAIGGTINVLTRTPPKQAEFDLTGEAGTYGWKRLLVSGGNAKNADAWRASLNLTSTEGWHDNSGYDRQAGTFRWDRAISDDAALKTVLSVSKVSQQHVGNLTTREFDNTPRANNIPFSYRKVDAFRLSTDYQKETAHSLLSITPYIRDNRMEIIPSWTVSYDPNYYVTKNQSLGFLSKYRHDFDKMRARVIVGLDFDYSPGSRDESSISLTKVTNAQGGTTYTLNSAAVAPVQIYNYDVTYRGISPYVHGEISPTDNLRLTAGLRYDDMQYDYVNKFNNGTAAATRGVLGAFPANGWFGHVASTKIGYNHLSPKLGATYSFSDNLNGFVNLSNSFRSPSEGQVFRPSRGSTALAAQASAIAALNLKPVTVDNIETGIRGRTGEVSYEVSVYHMTKKDDIVSYRDPVTTQTTSVNAGKTLHRGIEIGAGVPVVKDWRVDTSLSYAKHTYEAWLVAVGGVNVNYSGKEMETAPRVIANTRLTYSPGYMNGGQMQLEWFKLGRYWLDAANTGTYSGHDIFNLRASYPFGKGLEVYGNLNNLFDKHYAETASGTAALPTFNAGLPQTMFVGLQAKW
ncbi:MAG: TonB-dependent receptor [Nitrosomonadales bacterium]|nr:TonB-dependent receptor [Nitrosomonadales bacterium]